MSSEKTSFVYVTCIRSTPEKVFEAITQTGDRAALLGHENVSDWKPGSTWEHVRANDHAHGRAGRQAGRGRAADAPGHHLGERVAGRRSGQPQRA